MRRSTNSWFDWGDWFVWGAAMLFIVTAVLGVYNIGRHLGWWHRPDVPIVHSHYGHALLEAEPDKFSVSHWVQWPEEMQTNYRYMPERVTLPISSLKIELGLVDDGNVVWREKQAKQPAQ